MTSARGRGGSPSTGRLRVGASAGQGVAMAMVVPRRRVGGGWAAGGQVGSASIIVARLAGDSTAGRIEARRMALFSIKGEAARPRQVPRGTQADPRLLWRLVFKELKDRQALKMRENELPQVMHITNASERGTGTVLTHRRCGRPAVHERN